VAPRPTQSPARTSTSSNTRQPLTYVPLHDPRSRSHHPSSRWRTLACLRDTVGSVRTQSHSRERPSVTMLPTGRASCSVRGSRHASSTSAVERDTQRTAADKARTKAELPGRSATSSSSCARLVATKASSTRAENVSSDRRSSPRPARSLRITNSRSPAEGRCRTDLGVSRVTIRIFSRPSGFVHKGRLWAIRDRTRRPDTWRQSRRVDADERPTAVRAGAGTRDPCQRWLGRRPKRWRVRLIDARRDHHES
jgi:hypothetical protein